MAQAPLERRILRQGVRGDIQLHRRAEEALKECVMKFPRNARTLHEPLFKPQIELAGHLTNTQPVRCPKRHRERPCARCPEWPGGPPRRQDLDANRGALLVPCPPVGAALNTECIIPCG